VVVLWLMTVLELRHSTHQTSVDMRHLGHEVGFDPLCLFEQHYQLHVMIVFIVIMDIFFMVCGLNTSEESRLDDVRST